MMHVMGVWTVEAREMVGNGTIVTHGAGGEIATTIRIADPTDVTTTSVIGVGGIIADTEVAFLARRFAV